MTLKTPLEERVWAAAYALYWKEFMESVSRQASMGHFNVGMGTIDAFTGEEKTPHDVENDNRMAAEVSATTSAAEWADQAVLYLRMHVKEHGSLHVSLDDEEQDGET